MWATEYLMHGYLNNENNELQHKRDLGLIPAHLLIDPTNDCDDERAKFREARLMMEKSFMDRTFSK